MAVQAKESDLQLWGQGGNCARYDYNSEHYLMSDMLTNDFFCNCTYLLRKGDFIYITDAEDQIIVVRVDEVDQGSRRVVLSKVERLYALPVVTINEDLPDDPGLTYRWRPTRAGGHSIITAAAEVFAVNFPNRQEAERAIANIYESKVFEAPHGHEPTAATVSANTKTYKRA
jgi:hypothetical protein